MHSSVVIVVLKWQHQLWLKVQSVHHVTTLYLRSTNSVWNVELGSIRHYLPIKFRNKNYFGMTDTWYNNWILAIFFVLHILIKFENYVSVLVSSQLRLTFKIIDRILFFINPIYHNLLAFINYFWIKNLKHLVI
jgi:hypothetical protein